ncbi:hypothetical protein MVEG_05491 [Podila verticillata NRRL 6337]|nr:hypothetical protein MVEG_05491 [Podila verticillata NRRL 6337]
MKYLATILLSAVLAAALESPNCAMENRYQEVQQTNFFQDQSKFELEHTQNYFDKPKADDAVSIKYYDISCFEDNSVNRFYTTLWPIMVRKQRGRYNYAQSVDMVDGKRTYIDDNIPVEQVAGKGYIYSPVQSHKSVAGNDILKFSIEGWFGGLMIPILHDRENTKLDKNVVIEIVARDYLFHDFDRYCNPRIDAQGYRCDATFYVNATHLLGNVQALEAAKIREAIRVGPLDKGSSTVLLKTNARQASVFDYCEKRELSSPWEIIAAIKSAYEYICMVPGMPICNAEPGKP